NVSLEDAGAKDLSHDSGASRSDRGAGCEPGSLQRLSRGRLDLVARDHTRPRAVLPHLRRGRRNLRSDHGESPDRVRADRSCRGSSRRTLDLARILSYFGAAYFVAGALWNGP